MIRRLVTTVALGAVAGLCLVVAGGMALVADGSAHAAPPAPTAVTIQGDALAEPLNIRADIDAELFSAVMDQVKWLQGAGQSSSPKAGALGPKYTVTVLVGNTRQQTYDLYPLAAGGPRAFRPAKQPDRRKTTSAWFYGRLNMPDVLRAAGVPLGGRSAGVSGGVGGGIGGDERVIPDHTFGTEDFDDLVHQWRQLLLLNTLVVVLITAGLAGISLLVRRRTY